MSKLPLGRPGLDSPDLASPPIVLAFERPEPTPIALFAEHVEKDGHPMTVVVRVWADGDADRCRRCSAGLCRTDANACVVVVAGRIEGPEIVKVGVNVPARVSRSPVAR